MTSNQLSNPDHITSTTQTTSSYSTPTFIISWSYPRLEPDHSLRATLMQLSELAETLHTPNQLANFQPTYRFPRWAIIQRDLKTLDIDLGQGGVIAHARHLLDKTLSDYSNLSLKLDGLYQSNELTDYLKESGSGEAPRLKKHQKKKPWVRYLQNLGRLDEIVRELEKRNTSGDVKAGESNGNGNTNLNGEAEVEGMSKFEKLSHFLQERKQRGKESWRCLIIVEEDLTTIHLPPLLVSYGFTAQSITSAFIFPPNKPSTGEPIEVDVDFSEADYEVLVVPALRGVRWVVSGCDLVRYDKQSKDIIVLPSPSSPSPLELEPDLPVQIVQFEHHLLLETHERFQREEDVMEEVEHDEDQEEEEEEGDEEQEQMTDIPRLGDSLGQGEDTVLVERSRSQELVAATRSEGGPIQPAEPQGLAELLELGDVAGTTREEEMIGQSGLVASLEPQASREIGSIRSGGSTDLFRVSGPIEFIEYDDSSSNDDDEPSMDMTEGVNQDITMEQAQAEPPHARIGITQTQIGLPSDGLPTLSRSTGQKSCSITSPLTGRQIHLDKYFGTPPQVDGARRVKCWPTLSNDHSSVQVGLSLSSDIWAEVAAVFPEGELSVREVPAAHEGSRRNKAWITTLPPRLGIQPILCDNGSRSKRSFQYSQYTFIAALYLTGWLDHRFEFNYQALRNRKAGDVSLSLPIAPQNPGSPAILPSFPSGPRSTHRGPTQSQGGSRGHQAHSTTSRVAQGSNRHHGSDQPPRKKQKHTAHPSELIASVRPKFWEACLPMTPGTFCATLCRIKVVSQATTPPNMQNFAGTGVFSVEGPRVYRTMCILTKHRFSIPMSRSLPTSNKMVELDAQLQQGLDVNLTSEQLSLAQDYTVKLFSLPRGRAMIADQGGLPYFVLPMDLGWQKADEASSQIERRQNDDVAMNLAWQEIKDVLKGPERKPTVLETGGQGLIPLGTDALYVLPGSRQYEVGSICRDAAAIDAARRRLSALPSHTGDIPENGPVFQLRRTTSFWKPDPEPPVEDSQYVFPKLQQASSIAKSIYQSAFALPWIMWTIDGLLIAQEVNSKYLGAHGDILDVLAALSTTNSTRRVDLEVLEFAGDVFWKLAATVYQYYTNPTGNQTLLAKEVRAVTDNKPLAAGMKDCGAASYIQNRPLDPTSYVPVGCGFSTGEQVGTAQYEAVAPKTVADAAEALVGAVGSRANHEHILQTCIRLQPSAFPSSITWSNLADSSPLKHDNLELRATKVATVGQVVGYQFNQSSLLNLVLRGYSAAPNSGAWSRVVFLGEAIFEYLLMNYLIKQGAKSKLGPGALTRWRSPMSGHIGLSTLLVASTLHEHLDIDRISATRLENLKTELQKTINTHTELTMAWTKLMAVAKAEHYIYGLFGAVLLDNHWSMAGPQAVFNRICLPFFTRFVGTYDAERLTPLPTLKFVLGRAKVVLDCDRILVSTDLTSENLYHSRLYCHDHLLGEAYSVYEAAAEGFAGRETLRFLATRRHNQSTLDQQLCNCRKSSGGAVPMGLRAGSPTSNIASNAVASSAVARASVIVVSDDEDDFEIIDDPNVSRASSTAAAKPVVPHAYSKEKRFGSERAAGKRKAEEDW